MLKRNFLISLYQKKLSTSRSLLEKVHGCVSMYIYILLSYTPNIKFGDYCNHVYMYTGAFGVVHKGKLRSSDSSIKTVAIKSIKCT